MNEEEQLNTLEKITSGEIKMRPKTYFVLKAILIVLGIVFAVCFSLYIISFILFSLRSTGVLYLPGFGFPGIKAFFVMLPWILIAASRH